MKKDKLAAEFIGTFALVFLGAGAGALGAGGLVGVAFAHGLTLFTMVVIFGGVSGTHVNPAVTFGLLTGGKISLKDAIAYWIVQLLAGIAAAYLLCFALGGNESGLGATTLSTNVTPFRGFVIEAILTFFLVTAVYEGAVSGRGGIMSAAAIGFILAACIMAGGPLTGASLNPARTLGPAIMTGNMSDLWVYIAGPLTGGAMASLMNRIFFSNRA